MVILKGKYYCINRMSKVGYKYKKFQYFMNNTRGTIMKIIVPLDGTNMGFKVLHQINKDTFQILGVCLCFYKFI